MVADVAEFNGDELDEGVVVFRALAARHHFASSRPFQLVVNATLSQRLCR